LKANSSFPKRIISLVPSQTELLVELGCEEYLVGVTRFCTHPKQLRSVKKIVGGTKEIDFTLIEDLNPDLIICNKEENNKEDVLRLQKRYPTYTSDVNSLHEALGMIQDIAALTCTEKIGEKLIELIRNDFSKLKNRFQGKVAYLIWNEPIMLVGKPTFINSILELLGFDNFITHKTSRYPAIEEMDLDDKNIDYIFLSSEPYPFKEKNRKVFQARFPNAKIVLVDGRMFSWYGSCLSHAFPYFNALNKQLSS
jgi:ABC-type Fe3+-hydroxamate transport system substrate-binding protein